jgi:hypothetical protein
VSNENSENLKDLFGKFLAAENGDAAAEDLRKGFDIFERNPAPAPDEKLTAGIKAQIAHHLLRTRRQSAVRTAYRAVAAAAVLLIIAALSVQLLDKQTPQPPIPLLAAVIWDSNDIAADDAELALLAAEIEEIENELLAAQLGDNGLLEYDTTVEVEMELIEIDGDFWEG